MDQNATENAILILLRNTLTQNSYPKIVLLITLKRLTWYNQLYLIWLLYILSLQFAIIYNTFYISWMMLVINVFLPAHAAIVTFSILFGTSFCKSTHVSFIIHKFITRWVYYFSVSILLFRRYLRIFCGMIEYNVLNNSCFSFELLCSKPTYQTPL